MLVTLSSRFPCPGICLTQRWQEGTPPAPPVLASPNVTNVPCCCHGPEQPKEQSQALGSPVWDQQLELPTPCPRPRAPVLLPVPITLIHLISYRYTTGKIFLARSVLRQLKPNSSYWGISIHYQSCSKCSILSFFLLQAVWANNLQYFPEHREDSVI